MPTDSVRCSFCGKPPEDVKKVIAGPDGVFICDDCVDLCQELIDGTLAGAGDSGS